jgi:hypothetical protein
LTPEKLIFYPPNSGESKAFWGRKIRSTAFIFTSCRFRFSELFCDFGAFGEGVESFLSLAREVLGEYIKASEFLA